jgi:hypothetical protein
MGWSQLIRPVTTFGTLSAVKDVERGLMLPGPGEVDVANIERWPDGWPSGITAVPDLVEEPPPPPGAPVGPTGETLPARF